MPVAAQSIEAQLIHFFNSKRWPLADEKRLQAEVEAHLQLAGFDFEREVNLGAGDIIDFMATGVGIELKIKGSKREIYRQCERYCMHDRLESLLVVSNVAIGLPHKINFKPVHLVLLGRGWL